MLSAINLKVSFGDLDVLTGVNLEVGANEIVGLLGPNGAGKTTMLRAIMGIVTASGDLVRPKDIGYVPQLSRAVQDYPLSAEEVVLTGRIRQIGWFRRPSNADRLAAITALERVSLADLRERPISQLSGGQRQRVFIARALAATPELLLLDEPFTGIDQPTQDSLSELFESLRRDGTSMLLSTHDLAHAVHLCDRLVLLNRRVIAVGTPSELRDPQPWCETFQIGDNSPLLCTVGCR